MNRKARSYAGTDLNARARCSTHFTARPRRGGDPSRVRAVQSHHGKPEKAVRKGIASLPHWHSRQPERANRQIEAELLSFHPVWALFPVGSMSFCDFDSLQGRPHIVGRVLNVSLGIPRLGAPCRSGAGPHEPDSSGRTAASVVELAHFGCILPAAFCLTDLR
jgi:hypothetical protein